MDLTHLASGWLIALFVAGLVLLFGGGHYLVEGSSKLARMMGINPIIVGLTIVALGTSMPEFLVSLLAALKDKTDVALGNIVGSNVSNIGLILGVSAMARPLAIDRKLLKSEIPLVIVVSFLFWIACSGEMIGRLTGLMLSLGFLVYLYIVIKGAGRTRERTDELDDKPAPATFRKLPQLAAITFGIIALSLGASWVVDGASELSRRAGVPELILGLTIVAIGTSLPELATSLVAAIKKEGDISVGNIIGSNIFNMLAITGPSAVLHPMAVSPALQYHLPIMVGLTILLFPLMKTGAKLTRWEGGCLLACYVGIMYFWVQSGLR